MSENIPAVYGLIKYLWSHIETAGILGDNYGGLVPIVPDQEVPLLQQAMDVQDGIQSFPYIVYAWNTNGYDYAWYEQVDQVVLLVNSTDNAKLRELLLLVLDHFKRFDESAIAVNRFVQANDFGTRDAEYKAYDYKTISVQQATGGRPGASEDDPIQAMITIRVCYTNSRDDTPLDGSYRASQ